MNPRLAKWCASLIVDDWPVPRWLVTRLQDRPDVAEALRETKALEKRLRDDVDTNILVIRDHAQGAANRPGGRRHAILVPALAIAVAGLLCVWLWQWQNRAGQSEQSLGPVASANDAEPIIASLSAGETVARRVSLGLENVASELASAGNRLTAAIMLRDSRDSNALPIDVESDSNDTEPDGQ